MIPSVVMKRGKVNDSFAVDGVVDISGIDWFIQSSGGEGIFPNKPPIKARDTCATIDMGIGVNSFQGV